MEPALIEARPGRRTAAAMARQHPAFDTLNNSALADADTLQNANP